ncbi:MULTISPECIES: hypothetical protein [unclassified Caballeronia]|uniref:hypothetical protein n=1 Tax=unclassified Caballeronia TaxID=2646786 RepID=UPI001F3894F5|nr:MULTISPECIES: hypothetical protein [unclassified Caballeronia]MCE4544629.1 hypothetical protein [Caballeronia sp. PC1]MCE4571781.1 hypothetical protein [Caballeronia sp. CLC5]
MPQRSYVRNGHNINIDVSETKAGKWRWSYTIDAIDYTEMRDRPVASDGMAMLEAEHDANQKVDRMPAGKYEG